MGQAASKVATSSSASTAASAAGRKFPQAPSSTVLKTPTPPEVAKDRADADSTATAQQQQQQQKDEMATLLSHLSTLRPPRETDLNPLGGVSSSKSEAAKYDARITLSPLPSHSQVVASEGELNPVHQVLAQRVADQQATEDDSPQGIVARRGRIHAEDLHDMLKIIANRSTNIEQQHQIASKYGLDEKVAESFIKHLQPLDPPPPPSIPT
ncbi:hypothetical protein GQ42DRAFT_164726 [Ramicandelaber brevisporus]|nr:hypothetical protein GQ42DRAFT_164726 [Ramicandelaber brevisporus]